MASKLSQSGRQEVTSSHKNQFKHFQWINGNMHYKPFWKSSSSEEIPRSLLWMPSNYYQNRLVCPSHSKPNTETWRFSAEKEFIQKAAKRGDGRTASDLPPQRQGAWDIYGIKKQGGLRLGERGLEEGFQRATRFITTCCHIQCLKTYTMNEGKTICYHVINKRLGRVVMNGIDIVSFPLETRILEDVY